MFVVCMGKCVHTHVVIVVAGDTLVVSGQQRLRTLHPSQAAWEVDIARNQTMKLKGPNNGWN